MPEKLKDKVALVTGGSSGMGLAAAELFVDNGALVYITGRRREPLRAATARVGTQLRGVVADASDLRDIDGLFTTIRSETGRIDVLFASAGAGNLTEPLGEVTPESFDQLFGLNVRGTLFAAQRAAELMTGGGSIILNGPPPQKRLSPVRRSTQLARPPSKRSPGYGAPSSLPGRSESTYCTPVRPKRPPWSDDLKRPATTSCRSRPSAGSPVPSRSPLPLFSSPAPTPVSSPAPSCSSQAGWANLDLPDIAAECTSLSPAGLHLALRCNGSYGWIEPD